MISSSSSEPKPGTPLSDEAERILSSVPDHIGEAEPDPEPRPGIHFAEDDAEALRDLLPDIHFDPAEVGGVLEEAFDWMAVKFESDHWKLSERQSRMLARPTAELLSSLYLKLGNLLPAILMRWCDATPGLMGFLLTSGIVIAPKVAVQFQISRTRAKAQRNKVGPERVAPRRVGAVGVSQPVQVGPVVGPVGAASTGPVIDLEAEFPN